MQDAVPFSRRHVGPSPEQFAQILKKLDVSSLDELTEQTIPSDILQDNFLDLPPAMGERELLERARALGRNNKLFRSYIGLGYSGTHCPAVIQRSIMENPCWYTAYTPYQAEISQGRLEALLNFQTMVKDLTGMDIANASLLDEGTAIAEAMAMAHAHTRHKKHTIAVIEPIFPQSLAVLQTRAEPLGIEVMSCTAKTVPWEKTFAVVVQYPDAHGGITDWENLFAEAKRHDCVSIAAADIMSLVVLKPPGEMGADIVVGSTQRFGVPMGYGGPHAAYLATRDSLKRLIPGRIVGVSQDSKGKPAVRLALQTREQHIRREKATSNICTAQVLLAVMASMYAVFHGPRRLRQIALQIHYKAAMLAKGLQAMGWRISQAQFFDTVLVETTNEQKALINKEALANEMNFNYFFKGQVGIAVDEVTSTKDIHDILQVFAVARNTQVPQIELTESLQIPQALIRTSSFFDHPVFHRYRTETDLRRYITRLQRRDLTLADAMIPLGSCTMKLNAAAELAPVTWPEFASLHPFVPLDQAQGYLEMIGELERDLAEITGFAGVSLQPNAGSQGEYASLLVFKKYFASQKQDHRNICLIPSSAHGTNPASAAMAGYKVVIVECDDFGNVDLADLQVKVKEHQQNLAALMVTYPSTHGVFETEIRKICDIVHQAGGLVYMDGANFNAMVGLCQPGQFGPDACHLNLHKTFSIPHGGGGPGVGPIGLVEKLLPYKPNHNLIKEAGPDSGIANISAAPWGSAGVLPISWGFIRLMGAEGLKLSSQAAIMNANYIATCLDPYFPVLYKGHRGRVAHECIIDLRPVKESTGITVNDVAKRLMDYGFHAPTVSWPVVNTLMIEPTESESLEEIDRFCQAMISIRQEIRNIEEGRWPADDNPLVNAPHTHVDLLDDWHHPYTKREAFFALPWVEEKKFWPAVNRIDNAYGDKNLFCSCIPVEDYKA